MGWPKLTKQPKDNKQVPPKVPPLPPDLANEAAQAANLTQGPPR